MSFAEEAAAWRDALRDLHPAVTDVRASCFQVPVQVEARLADGTGFVYFRGRTSTVELGTGTTKWAAVGDPAAVTVEHEDAGWLDPPDAAQLFRGLLDRRLAAGPPSPPDQLAAAMDREGR